jgi:hypothetical protein
VTRHRSATSRLARSVVLLGLGLTAVELVLLPLDRHAALLIADLGLGGLIALAGGAQLAFLRRLRQARSPARDG